MNKNNNTKTISKNTITVMPESDNETICIELNGLINKEDHLQFLQRKIEQILKDRHSYNLLVYYGVDYKGWQEDAADNSMRTILQYGQQARKLAYVNPDKKKIMQHKMMPDLFGGEIRFFDKDKLQEALDWVKS